MTQRCSESTGSSPPHQASSPREVARQYAYCSSSGSVPTQSGSSAPFHMPIASAQASSLSAVTTSRSRGSPGSDLLSVARLIQV